MSSTITNTISCYPDSLLEPRVSIYSVPNILRISLLGPSTNLRPAHTNLSPISLPHVTKLRYCRGLLAGSRAEVVGAMEIQRRPVSIETINKGVYLDHWVVTGRPLRFAIVRRGLRPGHAIILWTLRIPQGVFASISTLSFVFHVRVRFCAGGVPPSFHLTYRIPN